jgi:integrase
MKNKRQANVASKRPKAASFKPYPDFPLVLHPKGYWCKKIRGKLHYFGREADGWEAAERLYQLQREDLYAGREPRQPGDDDQHSVRSLLDRYLTWAERRVENGKIEKRSFDDAKRTAIMFADVVGRNRSVEGLRASDFDDFLTTLESRYVVTTIAGHIARLKAIFNWAYKIEILDKPVRYGVNFRLPSQSDVRKYAATKPDAFVTAPHLHAILGKASLQMKAMILLGINCAYGNRDCSELRFAHLDLATGWAEYPRGKTGVRRRVKLWPETIAALQSSIDARKEPTDKTLRDRVFVTKYGRPWLRDQPRDDAITKEFSKLVTKSGVAHGQTFYSLRHTFKKVGSDLGDDMSVRWVMGHAVAGIDAVYLGGHQATGRIEKVCEHVRQWFLAGAAASSDADGEVVGDHA